MCYLTIEVKITENEKCNKCLIVSKLLHRLSYLLNNQKNGYINLLHEFERTFGIDDIISIIKDFKIKVSKFKKITYDIKSIDLLDILFKINELLSYLEKVSILDEIEAKLINYNPSLEEFQNLDYVNDFVSIFYQSYKHKSKTSEPSFLCAWCDYDRLIGFEDNYTHGICESCFRKFQNYMKLKHPKDTINDF
jgi:hypothetical protein